MDVSDEEVRFVNVVDVVATIQRKLAASAARTQEALILNGDTTSGATGNVSSTPNTGSGRGFLFAVRPA